jgi:hypothetical protein
MPKGMADQEALMIGEAMAGDGCRDLRDLHSGLFLGQLRDLLCAQMSIEQCLEHEPAGYTEDIRQHVPQLDVRIFEDLLHAVALAGVFPDQLPAPAGQIPQLTDREGWDEAAGSFRDGADAPASGYRSDRSCVRADSVRPQRWQESPGRAPRAG